MEEYHEVFEVIPDGITIHDPSNGAIVDANHQFCELLGYTRSEILELDFTALHPNEPPYTSERAQEYMQKAATGGPQTFEWRDQTKTGEIVPVEVHLNQTTIDGDERILAVVRDITERKKHERELERIYDKFDFALEATDTIIWSLNLSTGTSTDYGPVERLFGMEPDGLTEFLEEVIHPADREHTETLFDAVIEGKSDRFETEFRTNPSSTEQKWITSKAYLRDSVPEESRHLIGLATDITERNRRQEELRRKNERLEEFASIVSHDLRNPLNVAQGRLTLLEEEFPNGDFNAIKHAHNRMETLIEDILTLAREGESATDIQQVNLQELVHRAWQNTETNDATLTTETTLTTDADPSRLQRLLENLIHNAIEHSDESVTVTVGDLDHGFYVADDGPGIPEAERDRIFEAGYSTADTGTGFGLNIVHQIVEAHDWQIAITDSAAGGARFEIKIPDINI